MTCACHPPKGKLTRRGLLRMSLAAGVGYWLSPSMRRLFAADLAPGKIPAQRLIVIWLSGGPSHLDTFDPKPGAPTGGPFRAIQTAQPGLQLCEYLPHLAEVAQDLTIIRSMTSKEGSHARASFLLHTGYIPNPTVGYPSLGAIVSHERGAQDFDLPNFVSLGGPSEGAGFFGPEHAPFVVRTKPGQPIENLRYFRKVDAGRFEDRLKLVAALDAQFAARGAKEEAAGHEQILRKATRMIQSPLVKSFDIKGESDSTRKAYGASDFGDRLLVARRLSEAGVPAVEVELPGWDTHENNFERTKALMQQLDPALAQLLRDLRERKLIDSTVVLCMGEFGRTPKINPRDGRDHHPHAFSVLIAGGRTRTGQVLGATSAEGSQIVQRPIQVADLFATVETVLGIDPTKTFTANDRPISLSNRGQVIKEITG